MSRKRNLKVKALAQRGATTKAEAEKKVGSLFPYYGKRTDRKAASVVTKFSER